MKNLFKTSFLALLSLCAAGCTQLKFAAVNIPAGFDGTFIQDIAYGDLPDQRLDIYRPAASKRQNAPVIVFFYGGRWTDGAKEQYKFVATRLAKKGYVVIVPNYRKYPQVKFPDFVKDAAKAVAWTYCNIDKHGGDPQRLFVAGHSSGAHLGAMIVADQRYLKQEKLAPSIIKGFAGLAGPYDFVPTEKDLIVMFGPPERFDQMVVTNFIDGNEPPMALFYGEKDKIVWPRNHQLLSSKIQDIDGKVQVFLYPDHDHTSLVSDFSWVGSQKVVRDMVDFFRAIGQE